MSVQYEWKIRGTHKLSLRCDMYNVLNLINYKWGYYNVISNTNLYSLSGFDASTNSFKYSVNTSAGAKTKAATYYSVQFGAKYSF